MIKEIDNYTKRVSDLCEFVKGNEEATKQSLVIPLFTILGYDMTDPRQCIPEYKADFGKGRSTKPVDWAIFHNGALGIMVEAKEAGKPLDGYSEQLADYFAKEVSVKIGILTNGVHWKFFVDNNHPNIMDREPFAEWDVLKDPPPIEVITLLQKKSLNFELVKSYANRKIFQNLLIGEISRLLEPSSEFTKLAVANIETRNLTPSVLEHWKPIVTGAIREWAAKKVINTTLESVDITAESSEKSKIVTTKEELEFFEVVSKILGNERPCEYEDSQQYFKINVSNSNVKRSSFVRLQITSRNIWVSVPLSVDETRKFVPEKDVLTNNGWSRLSIESINNIGDLVLLLVAAYDSVK